MTRSRQPLDARRLLAPLMLLALSSLSYAPMLQAGYTNYDDPWLLADNPWLARSRPLAEVLHAILFDFSFPTRFALGAEYLPLRDLLSVLEVRVLGLTPQAMHAVSLALYAGALLLLRASLLRVFSQRWAVELAVLLFAVHPVHVESVAWLAGQKDLLALLCSAAALYVHASDGPRVRLWVPLLVAAACFSKSMGMCVLGLLTAQDFVRGRKPDWVVYGTCIALVSVALTLQMKVGARVGMFAAFPGNSRLDALITMGPVWLRYLGNCLFPIDLSIAYDVADLDHWSAASLQGYAFVFGSLALAWYAFVHGREERRFDPRLGLFAFVWFFAPLAPVSQVLVPLQNRMADRYLCWSVLAPCLLVAFALGALPRLVSRSLATVLVIALSVLSFSRSAVFSDDVALFADAAQKTRHDSNCVYQLGKALEARARNDEAIGAFAEVLRRTADAPHDPNFRRATNNYARLLAMRGDLGAAELALREALVRFPDDPKLRSNLAKVQRAQSDSKAGPSNSSRR